MNEKIIDKCVTSYVSKAKKEYWSVIAKVNNEMANEAKKIYTKFIDEFYSYKTTSYIRHYQSKPGTGANLYEGMKIKVSNNGKSPRLCIEYSGDDMKNDKYKKDDSEDVLNYVMNGVLDFHIGIR